MKLTSKDSMCDVYAIHPEKVDSVKRKMPTDQTMMELADFFRVFGDTTRVKILYALQQEELCVCDLASLLNMSISAISHQLRVLKQARLVTYRKVGKESIYRPDDDHIREIMEQGFRHVTE